MKIVYIQVALYLKDDEDVEKAVADYEANLRHPDQFEVEEVLKNAEGLFLAADA